MLNHDIDENAVIHGLPKPGLNMITYSYLLLVKSFGTHTKIWQPGHRLVRGVTGKVIWLVLYVKGIFLKRNFDISRYFQFENSTKKLSFHTAITTLHSRQGDREQFG